MLWACSTEISQSDMAAQEGSAEDFEKDFVEMKERCQVSFIIINIMCLCSRLLLSDTDVCHQECVLCGS